MLKKFKLDAKILFLILVGSLSWSLTMVKSGMVYPFGMGFWGPNGHDGIWHIALAESLSEGTWAMPIFAGETIKNYHVGFDLLLAIIHKLSFIPIHSLYFQILPPLFALGIGLSVYWFIFAWKKSKMQALFATIFVYFGGSFGWIVTLFRSREIGGESVFWSQQSISTLVNPPFALSILCIFLGLSALYNGLKGNDKKSLIISTFLFGILIEVKVYAGILVLTALIIAGLMLLVKRKGISLIKVFTGALIISILIFSPLSGSTKNSVVFEPFWFLESMVATPDRFYWPRMASAIANYKIAGNWIKLGFAYGLSFIIFLIGNLGTRVIGGFELVRRLRKLRDLDYIEVFIYTVIICGILIPMFFIQSGTPWNTIQFIYYSLIFTAILSGIVLGEWLEKRERKYMVIVGALIILTIPTTISTLAYHYLPVRPPAKISKEELKALDFLSKQDSGTVLTQPFNRVAADAAADNPPRPLYVYESTAYVSAFSKNPVYLEDEVNLEITGYDWRERRLEIERFYQSSDSSFTREFLRKNDISYVYWLKEQKARPGETQLGLEKIFENSEVIIYKVI